MLTQTAIPARKSPSSRLGDVVCQEPLIDTRLSLAGIAAAGSAPAAVFVGLGLCTERALSVAVPLDLLGIIMPAELLRRAAGAGELIVLVADSHAASNGFARAAIDARAAALEAALSTIKARCGLHALSVVRASAVHDRPAYREILAALRYPLGGLSDYVQRQVADLVYFERQRGSLLKVGWAMGGSESVRRRDEIFFDRALASVGAAEVGFAYCKPGRALADDAPRVAPYVVTHAQPRLCLDRPENPAAKIARARARVSAATVNGFRNYQRALLYSFGRHFGAFPHGRPLEARLGMLLAGLALV